MKIVCDCGEILEFEIDKSIDVSEDCEQINATRKDSNINIHGEHDEIWIGCSKCETEIHFFT